jgi:hypothetical protein
MLNKHKMMLNRMLAPVPESRKLTPAVSTNLRTVSKISNHQHLGS